MLIEIDNNQTVEVNKGDFVLLTYRGNEYFELVIGTSMLAKVDEIFTGDAPHDNKPRLSLIIINDSADKNSTISFKTGQNIYISIDKFNMYKVIKGTQVPNTEYIELQVL